MAEAVRRSDNAVFASKLPASIDETLALLKGGSDYRPAGSDWYVDGGPQDPSWELKLVLPGGGLERSDRIGFRVAYAVAP